jgi:hypothetical protein
MTADVPGPRSGEAVPRLPEKILPADLDTLNDALAKLFDKLRYASALPPGETGGRPSAVVALGAARQFLMQFEAVLAERLHTPLLNLSSALVALTENNVAPMLAPAKRKGRAISSPARFAMNGIAVGAAQQLEWTGLSPTSAYKMVATKLNSLGVKPTRGKTDLTGDTIRRWREEIKVALPLLRSESQLDQRAIGDRDRGWIEAARNAAAMVTEDEYAKIASMSPSGACRHILFSLEQTICEMRPAISG